ncbi:hypothetical protein BN1708_018964, partial [Verticillium longisporum]
WRDSHWCPADHPLGCHRVHRQHRHPAQRHLASLARRLVPRPAAAAAHHPHVGRRL